jgi:hypothetical protein
MEETSALATTMAILCRLFLFLQLSMQLLMLLADCSFVLVGLVTVATSPATKTAKAIVETTGKGTIISLQKKWNQLIQWHQQAPGGGHISGGVNMQQQQKNFLQRNNCGKDKNGGDGVAAGTYSGSK